MEIFQWMQVINTDDLQKNTILHMAFPYLIFIKQVIDHALYTLQKKSIK